MYVSVYRYRIASAVGSRPCSSPQPCSHLAAIARGRTAHVGGSSVEGILGADVPARATAGVLIRLIKAGRVAAVAERISGGRQEGHNHCRWAQRYSIS